VVKSSKPGTIGTLSMQRQHLRTGLARLIDAMTTRSGSPDLERAPVRRLRSSTIDGFGQGVLAALAQAGPGRIARDGRT
jgi:hypothetical protein